MEVLESLHGNVVCALAAGIGDYVRCTLLEYSYHDGQFWIFTEGGEKFIGLERNKMSVLLSLKSPGLWCAEKCTGRGNGKAHRADVI